LQEDIGPLERSSLLEGLSGWITQAGDNWRGPSHCGFCPETRNWTFGSAH